MTSDAQPAAVVVDQDARDQALEVATSFAVQAPAGSGKTELLTLRYMKLLATAQVPEEVLAITFTRKAAAEMADRIIANLEWAALPDTPENLSSPLQQQRFDIAKAVLNQDQLTGWDLLQSPDRLRIQTIDSFCNYLNSRLPVLSGFGSMPMISEQMDECYLDAIRSTLDLVNTKNKVATAIRKLLQHLDNNQGKIEWLLQKLLVQRAHWIDVVIDIASSPTAAEKYFRDNIDELIEESLATVRAQLLPYGDLLLPLCSFAANNLMATGKHSNISLWHELSELPPTTPDYVDHWRGLVQLLLTQDNEWRKKVDTRNGFPAKGSTKDKALGQLFVEKKADFMSLLQTLSEVPGLRENLEHLQWLPTADIDPTQWDFIVTLTDILPTLLAQLRLSFGRHKKVDYSEISMTALTALGSEEQPTDLALALDYQINHILVDEFQDTSSTQMRLLEKLLTGWQKDDGRSVFIVGDGMQSCYGFRNADVGLFLSARERGIGNVAMQALDLTANFRSCGAVVDWVNRVFSKAFPSQADLSRGAVSYAASSAASAEASEAFIEPALAAVSCQVFTAESDHKLAASLREAAEVAARVRELRQTYSGDSVAVLVRNRSHLKHILPALTDSDIPWQANDIHPLAQMPVIADLTSLLRALSNYADRVAWLSILRAPWCGLNTADLHALVNHDKTASVWSNMEQVIDTQLMSDNGRLRLASVVAILSQLLSQKIQLPISQLLRISWRRLRGSDVLISDIERDSVERFFKLVSTQQVAGVIADMNEFEKALQRLYVSGKKTPGHDNPVQILTIHKAKGLEFDHVILAGLDRTGRADENPLLLLHERLNHQGQAQVFLAALTATGADKDSLYQFMRFEQMQRRLLENTRLLYIAVTRAKKSALLLATLTLKNDTLANPPKDSLLATIWQALHSAESLQPELIAIDTAEIGDESGPAAPGNQSLRRFSSPLPLPLSLSSPSPSAELSPVSLDFESENDTLQEQQQDPDLNLKALVGTIIHRLLQLAVLHGIRYFTGARLIALQPSWLKAMRGLGLDQEKMDSAVRYISSTVENTLANENTNWVFDHAQQDSQCELAISSLVNGLIHTDRLDRSFIDKDNVRWIIDYKTAEPEPGQSLDVFSTHQLALHSEQLTRYKARYQEVDSREVKTALLLTAIPSLVVMDNN